MAEEAEHLRIRADLMIALTRAIDAQSLSQAAAAKLPGVTQPRISNLKRGKIDRFSIDTLVTLLAHAGIKVAVSTRKAAHVARPRAGSSVQRLTSSGSAASAAT